MGSGRGNFGMLLIAAACLVGCGGGGGGGPPPVPPMVVTSDPFQEDVLHYVEIEVSGDDLDDLVPDREERVPALLRYDGVDLENVGVRIKGHATARPSTDKPPFSVKTNEFVKGQALHGVKRFSLNNCVQDLSFLAEDLSYEVWRRAGAPVRRSAHARVTFNGRYLGVFVVTQSYEDEFLDQAFADDSGNLYEGVHGEDISDPYALELDTNDDVNDRSHLQALADVVQFASDADLPAALEAILDVDAFLTYWAVEALVDHWDGYAGQNELLLPLGTLGPSNWQAYDDPATGLFTWLPHGTDQAMQREDVPVLRPPASNASLTARLFAHPLYRAAYEDRLRAVLLDAWDAEALEARLDATLRRIEGSVREGDASATFSLEMFHQVVGSVRSFVRHRAENVLDDLDG